VNAAKAAPAKTSVTRLAAPIISMRNFGVIPLLFLFQPLGRLRLIALDVSDTQELPANHVVQPAAATTPPN
jgi:hypothetical protein